MIRVRWLKVDIARDALKRIAAGLLADGYRAGRARGFRVELNRPEHIVGEYIERHEWNDEVGDPEIGRELIRRVAFSRTHFRLSTKGQHLEVVNPSGALDGLIESLADHAGQSLRAQSIFVEPLRWMKAVSDDGRRAIAIRLRTGALTIAADVSATINLVGSGDVRATAKAVLPAALANVARLGVQWKAPRGGVVDCDLYRNGRATIRAGASEVIPLLRDALADAS